MAKFIKVRPFRRLSIANADNPSGSDAAVLLCCTLCYRSRLYPQNALWLAARTHCCHAVLCANLNTSRLLFYVRVQYDRVYAVTLSTSCVSSRVRSTCVQH